MGLLLGLRAEVRKAAAKGVDWRRVVDSLRPVTQILWQQLPVAEQKKFHARLFTLWNIHRHRMAPEIALKLETLQKSGRLHIVAGRINAVTEASEGLHVNYNYLHDKNVLAIVYAKMLVNCTGPDYDLRTSGHALLQRMLAQGLIQPSPLGIGISMTAQKTAQGKASSSLIPLGTLVIGELFECTAVPDLRQQTHDAACRALAKIS